MEKGILRKVSDLGAAAYVMMFGYKVVGRSGKAVIFDVESTGLKEFDEKLLEYLRSDFHRFDSCLMSLKKIGDYMPSSD